MKHIALALFTLGASAANAACYADYKAKQDDPLRLHYGVAEINGACTAENAENELASRLENGGWVLLTVMSVFDENGLEDKQDSAGEFYLRF